MDFNKSLKKIQEALTPEQQKAEDAKQAAKKEMIRKGLIKPEDDIEPDPKTPNTYRKIDPRVAQAAKTARLVR